MTTAVDLEQFCRDPYASGIQRVLQQLALHWPSEVGASFLVPSWDGRLALLDAARAASLLSIPFEAHERSEDGNDANHGIRQRVHAELEAIARDRSVQKLPLGQLIATHDSWLLPEVSYLPSVLERLDIARRTMLTTMIGYDALPMTDPANYRFVPGAGSQASEYFRLLASVDRVACISEWSRGQVLRRLRRSTALTTTVAHPGGDHVPPRRPGPRNDVPVFLRVGTMEARKRPVEIVRAFREAVDQGTVAELRFVGNPNASDASVNDEIEAAINAGYPVTWTSGATDTEVIEHMANADAFLAIGIEGYGIPVLESIRLGTPVLYAGTQPAAELMQGRGASPIGDGEAALAAVFATTPDPVVDPGAVPTWSHYSAEIASLAAP